MRAKITGGALPLRYTPENTAMRCTGNMGIEPNLPLSGSPPGNRTLFSGLKGRPLIHLLADRVVDEDGIEPPSPGLQPGARPLSYSSLVPRPGICPGSEVPQTSVLKLNYLGIKNPVRHGMDDMQCLVMNHGQDIWLRG